MAQFLGKKKSRVLIIRCAQVHVVKEVVKELKNQKNADASILGQSDVKHHFNGLVPEQNWYNYNKKSFHIFGISPFILLKIFAGRFHEIVIPSNAGLYMVESIIPLAAILSAGEIWIRTIDGKYFKIKRKDLLNILVKRVKWLFFAGSTYVLSMFSINKAKDTIRPINDEIINDKKQAAKLCKKAIRKRKKGDVAAALKLIERAVDLYPSSPAITLVYGTILIDSNNYDDCEIFFRKVSDLYKDVSYLYDVFFLANMISGFSKKSPVLAEVTKKIEEGRFQNSLYANIKNKMDVFISNINEKNDDDEFFNEKLEKLENTDNCVLESVKNSTILNIMHVNHSSGPNGEWSYIVNVCNLLNKRGHKTSVIVKRYNPSDGKLPENTKVYELPEIDLWNVSDFECDSESEKIRYILDKENPDIIQVHSIRNTRVLNVLAENAPCIGTYHAYGMLCPNNSYLQNKFKGNM